MTTVIPAEEIDTSLVDYINSLSEMYRSDPNTRFVFEGIMEEAMRENEPCAPAITVENNVDAQPCPPWEFVYCNRVLYGENVPRPDRDSLEGCDCLGPCNPANKDCVCVRKQEVFCAESKELLDVTGFAFNKDGTVKFHLGAVFGCNSKCSCDLECRNKVWQQGRKHKVVIRKTKEKGWGVFAGERIPAGSYIGIFAGELLTNAAVKQRSQIYDTSEHTYLFSIDFHHLKVGTGRPEYVVDGSRVGNFTRFLNHSCSPNLALSALYVEDAELQRPWIAVFSDQEIKPGHELTISYSGMSVDDSEDHTGFKKTKIHYAKKDPKHGK
ncbi:hypothetical protein FRC09_019752, partial [Ceratobasidium sp. 395]